MIRELYDPELEFVIKHHTLEKDPQLSMFHLSSGGVSDHYIDLRSAWLCSACQTTLCEWYIKQRQALARSFEFTELAPLVATGVYGAVALGYMAAGDKYRNKESALWNPKGHGVLWSGSIPAVGSPVVIIDDVVSTGTTLEALRTACEHEGWDVLGEIVPVRRAV